MTAAKEQIDRQFKANGEDIFPTMSTPRSSSLSFSGPREGEKLVIELRQMRAADRYGFKHL